MVLRAWGQNPKGRLGDGAVGNEESPVEVYGALAELGVGGSFVLALNGEGFLVAWGANEFGQLGASSAQEGGSYHPVENIYEPYHVAAGRTHALAVDNHNRIWAWGDNSHGQLGAGAGAMEKEPVKVQVPGLDQQYTVKALGAGDGFSVLLDKDGQVWTWGHGADGRLGYGTEDSSTPMQVPGLPPVKAISVGDAHVLALGSEGGVIAWGMSADGRLGDGSTDNPGHPIPVLYFDQFNQHDNGVAQVFATAASSFAVLDDGSVHAWGANQSGQLGDGSTTTRLTPVPLDYVKGAVSIAGGTDFTIAALGDGSVIGWGSNKAGQLGDGTRTTPTTTTTTLPPGSGITHVAAAGHSGYAY